MVKKTSEWMQPQTEFEASLVKSISELPIREVPRLDRETIAYMRMPSNECHANVGWYAKNDPTGETFQVTGWLMEWPDYTLHSVLGRANELRCITPNSFTDELLLFRPDDRIKWVETADRYSPRINGEEVPLNVRRFPSFTIARAKFVLGRLETVKNPYDALTIPMDQFDDMIREHVPKEFWPERLAA